MTVDLILSVYIFLFQCPVTWQSKWEGPEDPLQYLRSLVARALAIQVTLKSHFSLSVLVFSDTVYYVNSTTVDLYKHRSRRILDM